MTNEELAIRIQNGENELIGELWENNYKILYQMSKRFYNNYAERCISCGVEIEDIQQSCYFALCAAVGAYKQDSEYKFTTYINYSFKNAVNALLHGGKRKRKINPLNCSASLDVPLSEDSEATKADVIIDYEAAQSFEDAEEKIFIQELNTTLDQAIKQACNETEKSVLNQLYWNNKTFVDIARSMNVSGGKVHSIHSHALMMLRSSHTKRMLEPYREFITSRAYKGIGLSSFRSSGISSVERVVEQLNEVTGD